MLNHLSKLVHHYPRWILLCWLLMVLAALPFSLRIAEVLTSDPGHAPNSVAREVRALLAQEFAVPTNFQVLLIARANAAKMPSTAAPEQELKGVMARLKDMTGILEMVDYRALADLPLPNDDSVATVILMHLDAPDARAERELVARIEASLPTEGHYHYALTGSAVVKQALLEAGNRDARRAERVGLPLSLMILLVAFGAVVAAGLPLMVAMVTVMISLALLWGLGQGFLLAAFVQTLVSMLGLSTGINYALVMVHRFREELARGLPPRVAAAVTTRTAGRTVALSGLTVALALVALLIPPLSFVRSIGLAGMIVMLVSVAVATTALPALLALLGARVNALRVARQTLGERTSSFWGVHAERVLKRPFAWASAGVAILLALTLPALTTQLTFSRSAGLLGEAGATHSPRFFADVAISERSFEVVMDFGDTGFYHPVSVRSVAEFVRRSASLQHVTQVMAATTTPLPAVLAQQYYASAEVARASPLAALAHTTVSRDGRYALVRVVPTSSTRPRENAEIAQALRGIAAEREVRVLIGGRVIADAEWAQALYASLPLSISLVMLTTLLALCVAFRSLLIPIKAVLLNAFTIGAACGVVTLVFQEGWAAPLFGLAGGLGFVETVVPLFLFTLVFGLSMDYEMIVMSRLQEAQQRGLPQREAILSAIGATAGIITSAALIMLTVFVMFIFSDVVLIKALSLGLTAAVILDVTVVRLTLVPAILAMAPQWNWWLPGSSTYPGRPGSTRQDDLQGS